MRNERDEVGPEGRKPAKLLHGVSLGLIGPNVLDRAGDEASEQCDELELLRFEGARLPADERDHSERFRPMQERRGDPGAKPELGELALLRVLRVVHVLSVHRLAGAQDLGE